MENDEDWLIRTVYFFIACIVLSILLLLFSNNFYEQ